MAKKKSVPKSKTNKKPAAKSKTQSKSCGKSCKKKCDNTSLIPDSEKTIIKQSKINYFYGLIKKAFGHD